ncbi:MAG: hypothetical protein V1692_00180, partial [bacterium]
MKIRKILQFLITCFVITAWLFSGFPQVWQNPSIPPVIEETRAGTSPEVFASDGTFIPDNGIYAVTVECWGGGGGGGVINNQGGGGGGGGAYAKSTNVAVVPLTGYAVDVGTGGTAEVAGADSTFNSTTVVADGGGAAANADYGTGGTTDNSTGNAIESAGGNGGAGESTGTNDTGGGGGGAGGPNGAGLDGQIYQSGVGGAGGDSNQGTGVGDGGAAQSGNVGLPGGDDLTYGGGGGGGGDDQYNGGTGGTPGGGGGGAGDDATQASGAPGRCIVSYTDTWAPSVSQGSYDNIWTFATAPDNDADGQITMAATPGYDYNTISYSFTYTACASNQGTNGTNSGWQAGASYTDTGLDPNKCYGYTVQTKDPSYTGTASVASETYSSANTPGQPTLGSATETTLTLTNAENSNPAASPITYFAVQVVTGDAGWVTNWVNASGEPVGAEVWLRDDQLDGLVIGGGGTPLTAETTYGVKVKARNENGDPTNLSTEDQEATTAAPNSAPTLSISQPAGGNTNVAVGSTYNIVYSLDDTDNEVFANFAYDTNATDYDGAVITDCLNQVEGENAFCAWDTSGMTPGTYYIHATTTDGINPQVGAYSAGTITLNIVAISIT